MAEKFFLVDGHSHLYRAFFALRGLSTPDGRPTNAVFGFTSMIRKLLQDHQPDYLAVAFDLPGPTFRHKLFADYKKTRDAPPEELISQVPLAHKVLDALRIPMYSKAGYEADDVLGTAARQAVAKGLEVVLVTGDKDAEQLVGPNVKLLDTKNDRLTTEASLLEKYGFGPERVVEMMALSGDGTDNVPGVPKVGPKTAVNLIREYGTLEEVLARAGEMKAPMLRRNLTDYAEQARLSRQLVTIDTQVPIEINFDKCRVRPVEPERVAPVYQELAFGRFLDEMAVGGAEDDVHYHLVNTPALFSGFLKKLQKHPRFSVDLETTSPAPMAAEIVGLSFAWTEKEAWYIPVRAPVGEKTLDQGEVLSALRTIFEDEAVAKIGQNLKYDAVVLRHHGIELRGIAFDTMVAAYVLNAERRRYGLGELAAAFLNHRMTPISDLIGKGKKQITMDQVPVPVVCDYACADADIALRLSAVLGQELRTQGFEELFTTIELPLISVLVEMEYNGIKLNVGALREMSDWLGEQMAALETEIHAEAGEAFNVASPKQLSRILFEKLGLAKGKRTKTGYSTNSEVLADLAVAHRLPGLVLEYRHLSKLKSTYADALPRMVLPATGKVHTSFNQTATATGRLSSSDPNLQNIPVRTETGERIRRAFVPSGPGLILLSADYSQIELRILAHLSGDAELRKAFAADADIHRFVAAQIHGLAVEEVTTAMRRAAKAVNFGIVYGLSPYGLSRALRVPVREAEAFIDGYFDRYPDVERFIDDTVARAREEGHVSTLCGRRRALPGLRERNRAMRSFAERAAVNTVIQGTAADMMKIAMNRIHQCLRQMRTAIRMLLQIHDELLFELPPEEQSQAGDIVTAGMTGALQLDVPIKVNIATGKDWLSAK